MGHAITRVIGKKIEHDISNGYGSYEHENVIVTPVQMSNGATALEAKDKQTGQRCFFVSKKSYQKFSNSGYWKQPKLKSESELCKIVECFLRLKKEGRTHKTETVIHVW